MRRACRLHVDVEQRLGIGGAEIAQILKPAERIFAYRSDRQAAVVKIVLLIFVDEVAIMVDEIQLFARKMAIGAIEARFIMLAAANPELDLIGARAGRGQRAGAAAQAAFAASGEAVIIGAAGLQPGNLDMDAMAKLGARQFGTVRDDLAKAAVLCDFPFHRDIDQRHAAMRRHRVGCEAGPDDEAVARGIAGRDAEAEREIAKETGLGAQYRRGGQATNRASQID